MLQQAVANLYDQYHEVADILFEHTEPNLFYGMGASNAEMVTYIKRIYKCDVVDLFNEYNFEKVMRGDDDAVLAACVFIAFLRYRTFAEARAQGIGNLQIAVRGEAVSEYWFRKLRDCLRAIDTPGAVTGRWLH